VKTEDITSQPSYAAGLVIKTTVLDRFDLYSPPTTDLVTSKSRRPFKEYLYLRPKY